MPRPVPEHGNSLPWPLRTLHSSLFTIYPADGLGAHQTLHSSRTHKTSHGRAGHDYMMIPGSGELATTVFTLIIGLEFVLRAY